MFQLEFIKCNSRTGHELFNKKLGNFSNIDELVDKILDNYFYYYCYFTGYSDKMKENKRLEFLKQIKNNNNKNAIIVNRNYNVVDMYLIIGY